MASPAPDPPRRLLAHPEDVHCVVFQVCVVAGYALAFWLYLNPATAGIEGPADRAAFVAAAALLLGWCSGVNVGVNFHNHAHRRIFTSARWNRWFGRLWTVSGGWPAYYWQYSHVVVHHRNLLAGRDWTLPRRRADGRWEGFFRYCLLHYPWRYASGFASEYRRASRPVRRRLARELALFAVLFSGPFWIDAGMALWLWVLPAWLANVLVVGPGMVAQHAGREAPSDGHAFRHSNTFVSRLFNLAMFNIGYHAEHHTYPHVHWSELPDLHARVRDQLVAEGAHVVPFGYFRGGYLLSRADLGSRRAADEFHAQHPDYVARAR